MKIQKIVSLFFVLLLSFVLVSCASLPLFSAVFDETAGAVVPSFDVFLAGMFNPLLLMLSLVLINMIMGIVTALYERTFELNRVGDYFEKYIFGKIFGWLIAEFVIVLLPLFYPDLPDLIDVALVYGIRATLIVDLVGSIFSKIQTLGMNQTVMGEILEKLGVPREPLN